MKFTDFVEITDKLIGLDPDDIVSVCKRENNSKRDFLFVQKLQGKHVPARPNDILHYFEDLRVTITKHVDYDRNESICVIGFAETATAIGQYISDNIPNKKHYYLQTTREISDKPLILEFKEEHSHATEQLLYGDLQKLKNCDRILFVDDEISTGKTILNFVKELEKIKHFKYTVASFLNLQSDEDKVRFQQMEIQTRALIFGKIKDKAKKIDIECLPDIADLTTLSCQDCVSTDTLVIGTEEDMYLGILKAKYLEKSSKGAVYFQASTRSPICTAIGDDYILHNRINFVSAKSKERKIFLYNLKQYDRIIVLADQSKEMSENSLFSKTVFNILRPISKQIFILPYSRKGVKR